MKNILVGGFLLLAGCASNEKPADKPPEAGTAIPKQTGRAPVNGIKMYYEIHGKGDDVPLVLLHGGGSTIPVTWSKMLPLLARNRRVIAVEEQGHGRTTQRAGPIAFTTSADDIAALLKHLKVERADLFGFSNGAQVAMQVTIRHPALVRKLVFASAMVTRAGAPKEFWGSMAKANFSNMPQPLKDEFLKVNPDPAQLREMHDKDAARMQGFKDFALKDVKGIRAPTLILLADRDVVTPAHGLELNGWIQGSRLAILPGTHGDYLGELIMGPNETEYPKVTVGIVERFLDSR